jgi:serine/threonine protein kinase
MTGKNQGKTKASDIFSFGIFIIQLMTQKKDPGKHGKDHILNSVRSVLEKRQGKRRVSPKKLISEKLLQTGCSKEDALALIDLGLKCADNNPSQRVLISDIIDRLNNFKA